jgi:hypothetical protein
MGNYSFATPQAAKQRTARMSDGRNNYGWVAYFAFLIVASLGVMIFMIWYNQSLQLTPEQLQEARTLWEEKGPKNYDMIYTKRINEDPPIKFAVKVRGGRVQEVLMNGKPLEADEDRRDDPRIFHSMTGLLRDMERFMDIDQKPKAPKVYVTLKSDEQTGRVIEYIRRVMGTRQRVQITVEKFTALD